MQSPRELMLIRVRRDTNSANYVSYIVNFLPFNRNIELSEIEGLENRFSQLQAFVLRRFSALTSNHTTRSRNWNLSMIIDSRDGSSIVERQVNRGWRVYQSSAISSESGRTRSRGLFNINDAREGLLDAIMESYHSLAQSDRDLELREFDINVQFFGAEPEDPLLAYGKIKPWVRKSIEKSIVGVPKYPSDYGLCGYQAIIYAMVSTSSEGRLLRNEMGNNEGALEWLHSEIRWDNLNEYPRQQLSSGGKTSGRFKRLAVTLMNKIYLGANFTAKNPQPWVVDRSVHGENSTALRFVKLFPRTKVAIFNQVSKDLIESRTGENVDVRNMERGTILLSYHLQHLTYIKNIKSFMKYTGRKPFCCNCLKFENVKHKCEEYYNCEVCLLLFKTKKGYNSHLNNRIVECDNCGAQCHGQKCHDLHYCFPVENKKKQKNYANKKCCNCGNVHKYSGECKYYKCRQCKEKVLKEEYHICAIKNEPEPDEDDEEQNIDNYYAFDFESMLVPDQNNPEQTVHKVNLVVVKKCFSAPSDFWVFNDLEGFVDFMESCEKTIHLFAHNMSGYDGRLLFDYLFKHRIPPRDMLWQGAKIIRMKYQKVVIRDTLFHFTTSLDALPKMFNLQDTFKKGWFPHLFNLPENQNYKGKYPDKKYYAPELMSPKKRSEFNEWYNTVCRKKFDFKKELFEYCLSDVEILTRAIEEYYKAMTRVKPINPLKCITSASYAMKMYRTYFMPKDTIWHLKSNDVKNIRKSMHGGRTDTRCLLKEYSEEEISQGKFGCYQDVQSLYPTVQFYDPLPVGPPTFKEFSAEEQPTLEQIKQLFGFICIDYEVGQYLHHPIICCTDENTGRLVADLRPKENIVVTSVELQLALQHGYKIKRVHWWYEFKSSTELFKPYVRMFLKSKVETSGWKPSFDDPETLKEFLDYHSNELGVDIEPNSLVNNPSMRTGVKLLLNSLWGKFAERSAATLWIVFDKRTESSEIEKLERDWVDGKLDVMFRKQNPETHDIGMVYKYKEGMGERDHANVALASFVTAHARCRLWHQLNRLGERVLYHDTDSIIYTSAGYGNETDDIPVGKYLGEWENELGDGEFIQKFVSSGPKCYSYITNKGKQVTKVKGVTLNFGNSEKIDYEAMKKIVEGKVNEIETKQLVFSHDRNEGVMATYVGEKMFKLTYEKGDIMPNYVTRPFGWENLYNYE